MSIGSVTSISNNSYNTAVSKKDSNSQEFIIPQISEQQSGSPNIGSNNDVDPLDAMEAMTGKISVAKPSYTITEDEAEYFREKYGYSYSEEKAAELYYELADKGIVSRNDAGRASNTVEIIPLSAAKSIRYIGGGDPYGLGQYLNRYIGYVSDRVYAKDESRTHKDSPYKVLWDNFKKTYGRDIETWEDALQETIDFNRYVKENKSTSDYVFQQHREQLIEGLEKTKDVILKIFD